jgi:hypothetical protein
MLVSFVAMLSPKYWSQIFVFPTQAGKNLTVAIELLIFFAMPYAARGI